MGENLIVNIKLVDSPEWLSCKGCIGEHNNEVCRRLPDCASHSVWQAQEVIPA